MYSKDGAWTRRAVEDAAPDDQGWMWADGGKDALPLTEVRGANFEEVAPQELGVGRERSTSHAKGEVPLEGPLGGSSLWGRLPPEGKEVDGGESNISGGE